MVSALSQVKAERDALRVQVDRVKEIIAAWEEPADVESLIINSHFAAGRKIGIDIGVDEVLAELRAAIAA